MFLFWSDVFLFHFFQAPNFEVRANATLLLLEAFPIHDPDQNNKHIDEIIQKQLDIAMVRTFFFFFFKAAQLLLNKT